MFRAFRFEGIRTIPKAATFTGCHTCKLFLATAAVYLGALLPVSANAAFVTEFDAIPASAPTIDFAQFGPAGRIYLQGTSAPLEVDTLENEVVSISVVSGELAIAGDPTPAYPSNDYGLFPNGNWDQGRKGFVGLVGYVPTVARLNFDSGPVSLAGALFNYGGIRSFSLSISALGKDLSVLEQYDIIIDAPIIGYLANWGQFRGIKRPTNDIYALQVTGDAAVFDDVRFFRIPESGSLALATLMLPVISACRRFRRVT